MDLIVNRSDASMKERQETAAQQIPQWKKRERRKATKDRRQSVNDGLIVRLSTREERRGPLDRRKKDDRKDNRTADGGTPDFTHALVGRLHTVA